MKLQILPFKFPEGDKQGNDYPNHEDRSGTDDACEDLEKTRYG